MEKTTFKNKLFKRKKISCWYFVKQELGDLKSRYNKNQLLMQPALEKA